MAITQSELRFLTSTVVVLAGILVVSLLCGWVLAVFGVVALSVFNTLNYITFQYMNSPFFDVSYYLPRPSITDVTLINYITYILQYVPVGIWLWSVAVGVVALLMVKAATRAGGHAIAGMVVAILGTGGAVAAQMIAPAQAIPADLARYAQIVPIHRLLELGSEPRSKAPLPAGTPLTDTIVLIVNESTGSDAMDSTSSSLLSDRLLALSGGPGSGLFSLSNVVANATATDVSMPSILSGAYPTDGLQPINSTPLIFDYAKSSGFNTSFFSSSIVKWANLDKFLESSAVDVIYGGESSGSPLVNDFAVDDALMMNAYEGFIRDSDPAESIFLVIYPNALHSPFQRRSSMEIPADITGRRRRATYLIEEAHRRLFDALKAVGRFDRAAIFITGDHGLNMRPGAMSRLNQIDIVNLAPIFLVKPPSGIPEDWKRRLAQNADRLVANVDIAPTILDLLGYRKGQVTLSGFSLFGSIPENRISYALNNTEWRQWPQSTFSIARGFERFNCSVAQFCVLENVKFGSRSTYKAARTEKAWWRYLAVAGSSPRLALTLSEIIRRFFAGSWYFDQMETLELPLSQMWLGDRSGLQESGSVDWTKGPEGEPIFFGPYMPLRKGHYRAEWRGVIRQSESAANTACTLDAFNGQSVMAARRNELGGPPGESFQALEFTASRDEERFELRLFCDTGTSGSVHALTITSLGE
jgi:hypothetical protein